MPLEKPCSSCLYPRWLKCYLRGGTEPLTGLRLVSPVFSWIRLRRPRRAGAG